MKLCPRCNTQLDDSAIFCPNCGTQFIPDATSTRPDYFPANPADHTAEFESEDISENKLFALLPYILGLLGVIISLLAAKESPFVNFHIRQSLKLEIVEILLGITAGILAITIVIPFAALACIFVLFVLRLICFFRVCSGKSIEAPIVKNFRFLK